MRSSSSSAPTRFSERVQAYSSREAQNNHITGGLAQGDKTCMHKYFGEAKALFCYINLQVTDSLMGTRLYKIFHLGEGMPSVPPAGMCLAQKYLFSVRNLALPGGSRDSCCLSKAKLPALWLIRFAATRPLSWENLNAISAICLPQNYNTFSTRIYQKTTIIVSLLSIN